MYGEGRLVLIIELLRVVGVAQCLLREHVQLIQDTENLPMSRAKDTPLPKSWHRVLMIGRSSNDVLTSPQVPDLRVLMIGRSSNDVLISPPGLMDGEP
eukprot:NODE_2466_length_529_cov_2.679167_g1918_i0.p1 GENE.NODE_2466_length_529_cov_2.679167_g1918_i0~~NODE_2466_length_529_cov_2.679167_g1918_i0.p1  ORF type:complete len:98 (-),score=6.05 NODE_2466_length_529_cov_2.679167_g1918_i0:140-433(-)